MSKAEKFIQESTKRCSDSVRPFEEWLTPDQARKAVEIAMEEIYEWLLANADDYCFCARNFETRRCIYDLKQAMKDE